MEKDLHTLLGHHCQERTRIDFINNQILVLESMFVSVFYVLSRMLKVHI